MRIVVPHYRLTTVDSDKPKRLGLHRTNEDPFFALATKPFWFTVRRLFWISWATCGDKAGWRRELMVSFFLGRLRFYVHDGSPKRDRIQDVA